MARGSECFLERDAPQQGRGHDAGTNVDEMGCNRKDVGKMLAGTGGNGMGACCWGGETVQHERNQDAGVHGRSPDLGMATGCNRAFTRMWAGMLRQQNAVEHGRDPDAAMDGVETACGSGTQSSVNEIGIWSWMLRGGPTDSYNKCRTQNGESQHYMQHHNVKYEHHHGRSEFPCLSHVFFFFFFFFFFWRPLKHECNPDLLHRNGMQSSMHVLRMRAWML